MTSMVRAADFHRNHNSMTRNYLRASCALAAALLATPADGRHQLLVSGFTSNRINVYSGESGEFVRTWIALPGPQAIVADPDSGDLFVAVEGAHRVERRDGVTGNLVGPFVWDDPATPGDDTGGLRNPTGLAFGPGGDLFVASFETDAVLRYDGSTGAFRGVFVAPGSGGLDGPDTGIVFGPDGDFYVPSFWNHRILRFDGATGAFSGEFVPPGLGGLSHPRTILFRGDGLATVSSEGSHQVLRYDASSGAFVDEFVPAFSGGLFAPSGMSFGPDDGHLYVTSTSTDKVLRFDGASGAPLGDFVAARSGGLDAPTFLAFVPELRVRIDDPDPGVAGVLNALTVRGARPGGLVVFGAGRIAGAVGLSGCPGVVLGVLDIRRAGHATADAGGVATLSRRVPGRLAGATLLLQAVEPATCRASVVLEARFP